MKDFPSYGNKKSQSLYRKKTRDTKKSSVKVAITWILMIFIALFFVQQRISYIRTEKSIRKLMNEKENLQLSILPLKLEERYLTQLDRVEKIAKDKFKLQAPRQSQMISIKVNSLEQSKQD